METPYEKLLESLARAEVKFIIIGGVAVALNGFLRTTEDVDILVESSAQNIARLLDTLSAFGEGHARELAVADFEETEGAVRIIEDFPLDIFTVVRGKRYVDLVGDVRQTHIVGTKVDYLSPDSLIALKRDSQRERDQIDVAALRSKSAQPGES